MRNVLVVGLLATALTLPFWAKADVRQYGQTAQGGIVFGPILYAVGGYNPPDNNSAWGNSAWQTCEGGCPAW